MPADGAQAAAWRGISAPPAGSTDEITSVLAAQKEGENGCKWPDSAVSGQSCTTPACARWAMLSRSNSLHDLSADLAAAVCVGVNVDVPAASLQVGGLGVRQRCRALGGAGRVGADHEGNASVCAGRR